MARRTKIRSVFPSMSSTYKAAWSTKVILICYSGNRTTQKHSNYTLRAIVCHKGVIEGGHYWAIVR